MSDLQSSAEAPEAPFLSHLSSMSDDVKNVELFRYSPLALQYRQLQIFS